MTSKQKVLQKYPNARAERIPPLWYIFNGVNAYAISAMPTESQAWVNAAKSIEEKK